MRLDSEGERADLSVQVTISGFYHISLDYCNISDATALAAARINLSVDGISYDWMQQLSLERIWRSAEKIPHDDQGNEMAPDQEEVLVRQTVYLKDSYNDPMYYYFSEGRHTVTVTVDTGTLLLYGMVLNNQPEPPAYAALPQIESDQSKNVCFKVEAETYFQKSEASILPECDPANVNTTPNDPIRQRLNYIPGSKFKNTGNWIEYIVEIPESGYYQIDLRVRQNYNSGMSSIRMLTVDGECPFLECEQLLFPYNGTWYILTLGEEEPYRFYLTKGEHILRFTAVYGPISSVIEQSERLIRGLNALYNSVIMRIGNSPDPYRDYNLSREIPGIKDTMKALYEETVAVREKVEKTNGGKTGSAVSSLLTIGNMLHSFYKRPDGFALKMDSVKNNIESLAAWVNNLQEQPLDMDYIRIYSAGSSPKEEKASFAEHIRFGFKRLLSSFSADYVRTDEQKETLSVWVNVGRDQLKVLHRLVESDYQKERDVRVNLAINTDITAAILAGIGPDVCLFLGADAPVTLAVRNVLTDLSEFPDFEEISARFDSVSLIPFQGVGGCYALPLTESWPMLFVRNDIFKKLDLSIPQTWKEMYETAAVLQRNYLEIGIPSHIGMFLTLLYQYGGNVYNRRLQTTFYDQCSLNAFSTWSSFFSEYSFPLSYDFFNRFRSGEMPIGIADYSMYAQIKGAAPEIRGQWSMYMLPGVLQEDGGINRSVSSSNATGTTAASGLSQSVSAAVIFKDARNQQLAWDFLCWFTTAKVQGDYGVGIEAELGCYGRYTTANRDALSRLPWTSSEITALNAARENVVLIAEYPGNYCIAREVNNAFRSVVNNNANPADVLSRKNVLINQELNRKYKQFHIGEGEGT